MAGITGSDNRHAAVLASRIEDFVVLGPEAVDAAAVGEGDVTTTTSSTTTVPGGTAGPPPAQPIPPSQVPGPYASLAAVEVVLGGVDLTWETPGPNSYIYE